MARNYASISTAIWRREDDFSVLSVQAQWAYLMLISQPDISAAGVLSINLRRWTGRAKDSTRELLIAALKELADARYVVYDQDTEELLVRTFVKWDGATGNPKRQPVIRRAAQDIESPAIRAALAVELDGLGFGVGGVTDRLPDSLSSQANSLSGSHAPTGAQPLASPSDGRTSSQEDRLSGSLSASDGVVVTEGLTGTTTHNPGTSDPPSVGGVGGDAEPKAERSGRGTRLSADWQPGESLLAWFHEKKLGEEPLQTLVDIETETELFRNYWLAKSGSGSAKRDWNRTYQNWLMTAGQRAQRFASNSARASPKHQPHQNDPNADYHGDL